MGQVTKCHVTGEYPLQKVPPHEKNNTIGAAARGCRLTTIGLLCFAEKNGRRWTWWICRPNSWFWRL